MVLTFGFLPAFLSRPLRGHPPPGVGMDFFDKLREQPGCSLHFSSGLIQKS